MGTRDLEQEMESAAPEDAVPGDGAPEDAAPEDAAAEPDAPEAASESETPGHVDEVHPPESGEDPGPAGELASLQDRHLRLAAEFDNFRRRTRRELGDAGERARAELAGKLLELIDDLQRVAESPLEGTTTEALHEGIGLVARKFAKVLSDAGVEPVNPVDERFDPNLHDALMMTPTDDPEQDELVSHVVLIGYRLGDRLLRPARVTVYRHETEAS
ncbi:nucleotide exchange factor GrpE [Candidatus Palauibacter soopunensis]|uniref:nucleotide exchange factor GrpE n=1 Tax=Candidatus Palauibacter soopunensis TaxID=3056739 RepID=UPI00239D8AE5|nr:nucleotide exchange factor GrpE [Candidatus Palauibacter soopunensis]MDE2878795.1 nucleotide exchange factor GrpE [Candidatus Palauibacter soopunensis]